MNDVKNAFFIVEPNRRQLFAIVRLLDAREFGRLSML